MTKRERIPADRLAEAGVWIARLHGDDCSSATEAGFREWLKADPMNERAFELSTDVWEDSANLRRVVPFAHEVAKTRSRRFRVLAPVALAAAALVLAVVWLVYWVPETVVTGVGEQRLLALEDGSRVFLNTATRVAVRYSEQRRLVELESGEALFDVAKDVNRPFIVQVGDRQIRAVGTSFVVRRDDEQLAVTLVEGKVSVKPAPLADSEKVPKGQDETKAAARLPTAQRDAAGSAEIITLVAGQRLIIPASQIAQVDTVSVDKATAWRRGQVILDDTPLANAIMEMNRYNARKLVVENPKANDLIVNGLFQAGDSLSFANAVAQTYGLTVVEGQKEILLSGNPGP